MGLTILIAGIICYVRKINDNCLAEFYSDNKMQSLCRIPCLILKIVKFTFECCRCEYYDIVTITKYYDGTVTKETTGTSIICFIWNVICLVIKITSTFFTIIAYYIFLGFFLIIWKIAKCIYLKRLAEDNNIINGDNNKQPGQVNVNINNEPEQANGNINIEPEQNYVFEQYNNNKYNQSGAIILNINNIHQQNNVNINNLQQQINVNNNDINENPEQIKVKKKNEPQQVNNMFNYYNDEKSDKSYTLQKNDKNNYNNKNNDNYENISYKTKNLKQEINETYLSGIHEAKNTDERLKKSYSNIDNKFENNNPPPVADVGKIGNFNDENEVKENYKSTIKNENKEENNNITNSENRNMGFDEVI